MDEYDPYSYVKNQKGNPEAVDLMSFENSQSANVETQRVIPGGSWNNDSFLYLRVADRGGMNSAFSSLLYRLSLCVIITVSLKRGIRRVQEQSWPAWTLGRQFVIGRKPFSTLVLRGGVD